MPIFTTFIDISVSTLLTWLACHFVGDFAFQSTWMLTLSLIHSSRAIK